LARAGKMYRVPQAGPRRPAVAGPVVQRGVRPHWRSNSMTQLVSQVSPSSAENACSQTGFSPAVACQVKRTVTGFPFRESLAKKVPTQPENLPTTGTSRLCGALRSSHQIAHSFVRSLKDRNAAARTSPSGNFKTLSSTFPNPPRILRVVEVPSNSVQSVQPVSRELRRRCLTRHSPIMKSKSDGGAGRGLVDILEAPKVVLSEA
jgi:hypothetical protein